MINFSVIIPTYNRGDILYKTLDSLVNQSYKNFEVIVSDDGSTDNTEDIVNIYSSILTIKYIKNVNWGGPARPRNIGISIASNQWICLLDSDDVWYPDKLEKCKNLILKDHNVDVIFHKFFKIDEYGKRLGLLGEFRSSNTQFRNFKNLVYGGNKIVLSSVVVKKDILLKVGSFSEDKKLIGIEDFDWILRLSLNNAKFSFINDALGDYLISSDSLSSNEISQIEKVFNMLKSYCANINFIELNKIEALRSYMLGNFYLSDSQYRKAIKCFINSISNNPFSEIGFKSLLKLFYSFLNGI